VEELLELEIRRTGGAGFNWETDDVRVRPNSMTKKQPVTVNAVTNLIGFFMSKAFSWPINFGSPQFTFSVNKMTDWERGHLKS
jgi:hypothetical protein